VGRNYNKQDKKESPIDLSTMVYGKIPPQATELERAVLGAILLEKSAFDHAADIITAESFYVDAHQRIFAAIKKMQSVNLPIDVLTVAEQLKKEEELAIIGGPYYLTQLTSAVVSSANIETHARIIQQKYIQRQIISTCGELISDAYNDSTDAIELLEQAEEKILSIGANSFGGSMKGIDTVLVEAIEKIEEYRRLESTITGIPSGYPAIDEATRGWQNGDLIILAARPSVGKTAFALNIIRNAALNQLKPVTVAVWSLEMKAFQLAFRMMAAESKILLYKLQTGRMTDEEMGGLYQKAIQTLINAKIYFDDSSTVKITELKAKARRLKKKQGLGLIVVDYIQLMKGEKNSGNRDEIIGEVAIQLKNLAMDLNVPVIGISSLSRETEKSLGQPKLSHLRESGAIEYAADVVMLLFGHTEDEIKQDASLKNKRFVKIAKQRNGMLITEEFDFQNDIQLYQKANQFSSGGWAPPTDHFQDNNTF
jgi:replicative DNA helicase